jgi:tRNA 2-thiouridine synthesizing protein A
VSEPVIDSRGRRCPLPVINLARAAREAAAGTRLVLLATDPAARADVAAWCRMRGHSLVETTEDDDGVLRFVVQLT